MKFTTAAATQPHPTQQGAQFEAPWKMTLARSLFHDGSTL
jgi:hypothetical protein